MLMMTGLVLLCIVAWLATGLLMSVVVAVVRGEDDDFIATFVILVPPLAIVFLLFAAALHVSVTYVPRMTEHVRSIIRKK